MKKIFFSLFISFSVFAQNDYPQGYFTIPLANTPQVSLSGAYGDIRINHFHSGLDIRTGGVEGKRVVAAADGYISRIRVQLGGYGNVLYITHPNGYTTVYAHLKELNNELNQYLIQKQYEQKKWEIDVVIPEGMFNYKKGEFVALSGNTGGSGGPHLHFEIRDQAENTIDPRLFGFKEIRDNMPPVIEMISIKTVSDDALINGKFGSFDFKPIKSGSVYTLPQNIRAKGVIAVEVLTYDKMANSPFRLGVNQIELGMNGEPQYKYQLNKMSFDNKLDMNIHVNYQKQIENNLKIHKAYVEEANGFDFYESNQDWGKLRISEVRNNVSIKVKDSHGNMSTLNFTVVKDNSAFTSEKSTSILASITDSFLKIVSPVKAEELVIESKNGDRKAIPTQKSSLDSWSAVYNLENGFPSTVYWGDSPVNIPVNTALALKDPVINIPNLYADLSGALYNDTYISLQVDDEKLILHKDVIPLKSYFTIKWTKNSDIKFPDKQKVYLQGKRPKFIGGTWENNTIRFSTRELGTYVTLYDFDPPKITPVTVNKDHLKFRISDSLSGIKKIECYVDNEWVLMDYEYKTGDIWSKKLDKNKPFSGKIVLKVTDNCNNTQSYETDL